jgi:hypothetical protein
MTKEMVLVSWGNPADIRPPGPGNGQEVWIYSTSQTDKSAYVYFEDNILARWEE